MTDNILNSLEKKMNLSLDHYKSEISSIVAGKANIKIFENLKISIYGDLMHLNQVANINLIDNLTLNIMPYDKSNLKIILSSIQEANLPITLISEATSIKVLFSKMTEEKRKEIVKIVNKLTEDTKIKIRNIRREFMDLLKNEKSEDIKKKNEKEIQKIVDLYIDKCDQLFKKKEEEIMKI